MTDTVTARYTVRMLTPSDTDMIMRAQVACQYELFQSSREEIQQALWHNELDGFVLIGPRTRMCIVTRHEENAAALSLLYREGPPVGLRTEAPILWEKVVDYLQTEGVTQVVAYVHRENPQFKKLMRFYKWLGWKADMVRVSRSI